MDEKDIDWFFFWKQNNFTSAKKAAGSGKAKVGKAGPISEKITFPVEKDANKLVNYVCGSNILNDGEDIKVRSVFSYTRMKHLFFKKKIKM